jgi:hypothetical protein
VEKAGVLLGYTQASEVDLSKVHADTRRELAWHNHTLRYASSRAIASAFGSGKLEQVMADENFSPIARYLNPDLRHIYPPYLRPYAHTALKKLTTAWRSEATQLGVDARVKLAVTSMVRSLAYQDRLIEAGKLAISDSVHTAGAAFDIDCSGYYVVEDEQVVRVSERPASYIRAIGKQLARQGTRFVPPAVSEDFDGRVSLALERAATDLHDAGIINAVREFSGTPNACLHVAVNPALQRAA